MIKFTASIPDSRSAIKIDGKEGMKITLEIPETHIGNAIRVVNMRNKLLTVTIEIQEEGK